MDFFFGCRQQVKGDGDQSDNEKLLLLRTEYERYKDLWGLNIHYSHSAGPTQNYSKTPFFFSNNIFSFISDKEGPRLADGAHLL